MAEPIQRTFRLHDTTIMVSAPGSKPARSGRVELGWKAPDYETFNRLLAALNDVGFVVSRDPDIERRFPTLGKDHRVGRRPTPAGELWFHAEASPIGCKLEFYQEQVTVNSNGGRHDFDKRQKMPYLIGKAFEVALRAVRRHLSGHGFVETVKVQSPQPDPLAYFNDRWDGEYERRRGEHRFRRGPDGWPDESEIGKACWGVTAEHPLIAQGSVWYFRTRAGHLMRGRCYGGINGMWTVIYGPGRRDYTSLARHELFQCSPASMRRRAHPRGRQRLRDELDRAVAAERFERAIVLRDQLAREVCRG